MSKNELISNENVLAMQNVVSGELQKLTGAIPQSINSDLLKANAFNTINKQIIKEGKKNQNHTLNAISKNPDDFGIQVLNFILLGLDMARDEAHLLAFKDELTPIIDWKGMKKLMLKYSIIPLSDIKPILVFENDVFEVEEGEVIKHNYDPFSKDRGNHIGTYVKITRKDGIIDYEFMSLEDLNKVKAVSKSASSEYSPWNKWFYEMAKGKAIRKCFKNYPLEFDSPTQSEILNVIDSDVDFDRAKKKQLPNEEKTKEEQEKMEARGDLIKFANDNDLDINEISQKYKLNATSKAEDFIKALEEIKKDKGVE
jgi:recombinational DNA repair protein RecT